MIQSVPCIVRTDVAVARRPLRTRFSITGSTADAVESVMVRLEDETGHVGLGETTPMVAYSGVSVGRVLRLIGEVLVPAVRGAPATPAAVHAALDRAHEGAPLAKAALDIAVHDLLGRRRGLPVHELLGGALRDRVPLAWVLGFLPEAELLAEAERAVGLGYRTLKLKVGVDPDRDVAAVLAVRRAWPGALRDGQLHPIDNGPVDGGIWHDLHAHEGDPEHTPIASPWMSPLIADALTRAYLVNENSTAEQFLVDLAGFECGVGSYMTTIRDGYNPLTEQSGGVHQYMPHYLATRDGLGYTKEFSPYDNKEHAGEVGSTVAWGAYFAEKRGDTTKANNLKACAGKLYKTWGHVITSWIRPDGSALNYDAFRVDPERKYNWWFKNSSGFEWAMNGYTLPTDPAT